MAKENKIKHSIYSTARQIAKETAVRLNTKFEADALDVIAELAWKKLLLYGLDLESFEKHAKRSTVTVDDVKLLVRRNDSLKELLDDKLKKIESNKPAATTSGSSGSVTTKRKRK